MRFSGNVVVGAISLGASEAAIRFLRSRLHRRVDSETNPISYLVATWFDSELEKVENAIRKNLRDMLDAE